MSDDNVIEVGSAAYGRARWARLRDEKAAGIATRTFAGIEVESAVILQPESPWAGWLAALIDGEGHLSADPVKVTVTMCDRDVLEKAQACTGVGVITGPFRRGMAHHTPISRWRVHRAADCWVIGHLILPYLGARRSEMVQRQFATFEKMTVGKVLHGTRAYYKRGCRCQACATANYAYTRRHLAAV